MKKKSNKEKDATNKLRLYYLKNRYFLSLLILVIIGFGHNLSEEKIINSNNHLFIGMFVFTVFSLLFFYLKKKKGIKLIESSLFWGIALGFLSFWSFNYLNIKSNNKAPIQIANCELKGTSLSRMTRGFYFSFKGEIKFISGFYDFMRKLESKNYENDLILTLHFSKGWDNSYIIHSWKVKEK
ncbi:hypothetical protein H3Z83_12690 [Tenacibaculum sp. S7007]|uniref:Uncharacterized protein n=1 Tax=Tenacibaculum pelagium TaxID=2759527 RepID=A0A839ARR6_9FLAO|nr:hypothetical protein [Tenacibaculum pelagium]MBA6157367.1 hypothetical protein [Tenacibaculum pelagium]